MNTSGTSVDLTPAVLLEILNDAIHEGRDIIVNKWLDYFTDAQIISVIAGSDTYPLESDFYKLRAVWILDGSEYKRLKPASLDAAHRFTGQTVACRSDYRYRVTNRNLCLMPVPNADETLRVFYVPSQAELAADGDTITFDVPVEHKFILAIAWREVLDRQGLDPSPAIAKIDRYEKQLRTAADSLDAAEPFYLDPNGPDSDDEELY